MNSALRLTANDIFISSFGGRGGVRTSCAHFSSGNEKQFTRTVFHSRRLFGPSLEIVIGFAPEGKGNSLRSPEVVLCGCWGRPRMCAMSRQENSTLEASLTGRR